MEREIKFRAWDSFNKRMDYSPCISFNVMGDDGKVDTLVDKGGGKWRSATAQMKIMQYTGLKDKNGKEIYESDIVKTGSDKLMVISWSEKHASFVIDRNGWAFRHYFGEAFYSNECEVVGNLYESPELLNP